MLRAVESNRTRATPEGTHPRAPCTDVGLSRRDRGANLLKKPFQPPSDTDEEGVGGTGCWGAAFSVSQIVQLLLPDLCFAPHIYTKGGHRRNAGELCSLSTLRFLFLISGEEIGHPFPPLHPHIQTLRAFTLFPPLSPTLHLGVGSCSLYANWGFKAG